MTRLNYRVAILSITTSQTLHTLFTSQRALVLLYALAHCPSFLLNFNPLPSFSVQRQNEQEERMSQLHASIDACIQSQAIFASLRSLTPAFASRPTHLQYSRNHNQKTFQYPRNHNPRCMPPLHLLLPSPNFTSRKPRMLSSRCLHQLNSQC